jgi:hypothetical protein
MHGNRWIGSSLALGVILIVATATASAHDESKYPDWSGQWRRPEGVGIQWDPSKRLGRDEQAPLTAVRETTRPTPASRPACRER